MRCPYCQEDSDRVVDTRQADDQLAIRRRRECLSCGRRYTTYERFEESQLKVVKKDGSRQAYERQKLMAGLMRACEKRPVSTERLEALVGRIEGELVQSHEKEVPSGVIGEKVCAALKDIDGVAYVRFASVYRDFKDVTEFARELQSLGDA